jgi:dTDP-4-amino-4,6-dideoxygalactose transaminase
LQAKQSFPTSARELAWLKSFINESALHYKLMQAVGKNAVSDRCSGNGFAGEASVSEELASTSFSFLNGQSSQGQSKLDLVFGKPVIEDAEINGVIDCLRSRWIGLGPRVREFEEAFTSYKGSGYAAAVSSGTAALHVAMVALGISSGDEVIAPSMTFCSTIHSIIHTGATPVLVDCYRDTLNIDADRISANITPRTKAILVVHLCGRCCDMDPVLKIARKHGLKVIEDCAHSIESTYRTRAAGLLGHVGCFSFYPTKNVTTCEGGMVLSRNKDLIARVRTLSTQGMTSHAWNRLHDGHPGYRVVAAGFKYNMTDLAASLGLVQLRAVEERWNRRNALWHAYNDRLQGSDLILPLAPDQLGRHGCHLYTPLLPLDKIKLTRNEVIMAMRSKGIGVGVHYVPVHQQPYYKKRYGYQASDFPNSTWVGRRTISLPLTAAMNEADVTRVSDVLLEMVNSNRYKDRPCRPNAGDSL